MLLTLYTGFLVAISSTFVPNVYSQSDDCGHVSSEDRVNGDWPWMVAVIWKDFPIPYSILCNGFIIDRRHVIIPARCVTSASRLDEFTAHIGKADWPDGEEYRITCITRHHRFVRDQVYDDIAILTLSRDVDTPNYSPICLPDDSFRTKRMDGLTVLETAWGYYVKRIESIGVRIISNNNCSNILSQEKRLRWPFSSFFPGLVSGDMLCAVNPTGERELCARPTGALLMYKDNRNQWIAVGMDVSSFRCAIEAPRIYMKIYDYVQWIEESTANGKDGCS